jgi:hypothetical protein
MGTKRFIAILTALLPLFSFGQGDLVIINGVGNRDVPPAYRISMNPTIIDTVIGTPVQQYPLLSLRFPTKISVDTIKPVTIKVEPKLQQLYSTYVKLGIGSELMPLGEVYFDSKRSRKYVYGVHAKHLSSFGNFTNYAPAQFDRTRTNVFGSINEKSYSQRGDIHYNNQGLNYYGWQIPTDSVDRSTIAQRYQDLGGAFSFNSHKKDSAQLNYKLNVAYNHFNSKKPSDSLSAWRGSENYIAVGGSGWYRQGKEVFAAEANVRYNGYRYGTQSDTLGFAADSGLVLNNTVINLKPTVTTQLWNNRFRAIVGFDFVVDAQTKTKVHLYPVAEVKYSLFNDIFIPFIGVRGGLKQRTFRSTVDENEFVLSNLQLKNENTSIDVYGGFKGTLSSRISFNVNASFARIKDKAFFITDTTFSVGNKFGLIYDTLNQTTIEASASYQLNEKLKVDVIGRYYSYLLLNNTYAWNLPQWQAGVRGSYNLYDKFLVNLDVSFEGGRKALVYEMGDGVTSENGQLAQSLGLITDINLGLEYRYNKRVSAFIQFNNLASQRYFRWYNYPVQIFQVMGGVTARF